MAPLKKPNRAAPGAKRAEKGVPAMEKIAGALALIATKAMDKDDAALALDAIGFTTGEISALLGVHKNYVMLARFRKRNGGQKAGRKKAS
jgi:hypothetical protein